MFHPDEVHDVAVANRNGAVGKIDDPHVIQRVEQFVKELEEGKHPDRQEILRQYPDIAEELNGCLDALETVHRLAPQFARADTECHQQAFETGDVRPLAELGDFRIIREIGRGGMGVVFEAEQVSLGRRVALKMLPFAAVLDPKQLQRFENEARAAAGLDHPHIVRVFSVGCEGAVHYYSMQYIEGLTLAQVIAELRLLSTADSQDGHDHAMAVGQQRDDPTSGHSAAPPQPGTSDQPTSDNTADARPTVPSLADARHVATVAISADGSIRSPQFFRSVARLGIQAAEALEHAHQMGVVHRDIKPSNLMVDVGGHVWITDFGLAMTRTDANLTMSGDVLGTLRYMSPEQVAGKRSLLDQRTDIYSLGVTLYELLTLRAAFEGDDREQLLQEISCEEPRPPRRLNRSIPRDLETIVLKATAKEPQARYSTGGELAADLRRFLADKPVRAKRPALIARTVKWSRRHRAAVCAAAAMLVMAVVLSSGVVWNEHQRRVQLERSVTESLAAATAYLRLRDFPAAREQLGMARGRLDAADYVKGPLRTTVAGLADELSAKTGAQKRFGQFQQLRQNVHAEMYAVDDELRAHAQDNCGVALGLYGVLESDDWQQQPLFNDLDAERRRVLREDIVELLFIWARLEVRLREPADRVASPEAHHRAIDVLQRIETIIGPSRAVYLWLAESHEALGQTLIAQRARQKAVTLQPQKGLDHFMLGELQSHLGHLEQAVTDYALALRIKPDHYLSLLAAGVTLIELGEYPAAEGALTGAIALNPQTILAYVKRARSCVEQGKDDLAQADFVAALELDPRLPQLYRDSGCEQLVLEDGDLERAIENLTVALQLDPTSDTAYNNRGSAYYRLGEYDRAIAEFNQAIDVNPASALAFANRGVAYKRKGDIRQAISDGTKAIELSPEIAKFYIYRGLNYRRAGDLPAAIADLTRAIQLDTECFHGFHHRGHCYHEQSRYDLAISDFTAAIQLDPNLCGPYNDRGVAYDQMGESSKAIADLNKAIELNPSFAKAYNSRGVVYKRRGNLRQAISDYTKSIQLDSEYAAAYLNRGAAYEAKGDLDRAIVDFSRLIQINPQHADAHSGRAFVYERKGNLRQAVADYTKAIQLDPTLAVYYNNRGRIYRLQRKFDDAIADLLEAIRLAPNVATPYFNVGMAYHETSQYDHAISQYTEAIRLNSKFTNAYMLRGVANSRKREYDNAFSDFAEAIRLAPKSPGAYRHRGKAHLWQGDLNEAVADYSRAVQLDGQHVKSYNDRGCVYLRRGELDKAIADFNKALKLDPKYVSAYHNRGVARTNKGELDEAINDFTKAIQLDSKHAPAYAGRADSYRKTEDLQQAIGDYDQAIAVDPECTVAYCGRALARAKLGNVEEALHDVDRALQINSDEPFEQNSLAWQLATCPDARMRNITGAVELAEQAVKQAPKNGLFSKTLGVAYYRAGDWHAAVEALNKATELGCYAHDHGWFFLAMAYWQVGEQEQARQWYDRAVKWMEKQRPDDDDLRRFQAEAAALLEINEARPGEEQGLSELRSIRSTALSASGRASV